MDALAAALGLNESAKSSSAGAGPGELYPRERKILDERRVLPLVLLPEFTGIGANVRDWMPARWGAWNLADVWLDDAEAAPPAKSSGVHP